MRHYPLLSLITQGPARPLQPCHGVGAPQYSGLAFGHKKCPHAVHSDSLLSLCSIKLSTANIQINFNTVHSPAHFFSIFRRFCARSPIVTRSQPVPVGPFAAGRPRTNKFQYRVRPRTLFFQKNLVFPINLPALAPVGLRHQPAGRTRL